MTAICGCDKTEALIGSVSTWRDYEILFYANKKKTTFLFSCKKTRKGKNL